MSAPEADRVLLTPSSRRAEGPAAGFALTERLDPFWDGVWPGGSTGVWVSAGDARRQSDAGVARLPWFLRGTRDDGLSFMRARAAARRAMVLAGLGAVDQWRTMTTEQLAAMTRFTSLASRANPWLRTGFSAGVLDVGAFGTPLPQGQDDPRRRLVRPAQSAVFDREVAPWLRFEELVSVTGGIPWDARRQFDRHNILATELGLRVAELCDIGTVLGEKLSTLDLLLQLPPGATTPRSRAQSADLTIVRRDGLRIAVEITASANRNLRRKVERWARTLSRNPLAASGLVVLFVVCPPPQPEGDVVRGGRSQPVLNAVLREVAAAARRFPGTATDRVAARIAVARWQEWFPGAREVADGVRGLLATRPTGPPSAAGDGESRLWEAVPLLDTGAVPFMPHERSSMTAVIDNASLLGGTPRWLRHWDSAPDLASHRLAMLAPGSRSIAGDRSRPVREAA
ncbi:hypothetical protein GCM10027059_50260 [Myceligenerans halotolerans]